MGNKVFVREIVDGHRKSYPVSYKPTLYLPADKNKETSFKTPDGDFVKPVIFEDIKSCRDFIKRYEGVESFEVFGINNFAYAWISDNFPQETIDFDINKLSICNIDIEVACENGFSDVKDATEALTAITFKNSLDKVFHVFGTGEFITTRTDVKYYECSDEIDMIEQFLQLWEQVQPDIVTGWNIKMFDIPYLVNRITRVMGPKDAKRLSPWKMVMEKKETLFHREVCVYDLAGLAVLDYMAIYRKNVMKPRESYSLNNIANVELGEQKLDYSEVESLSQLYKTNHQKFIEYNIHDVELVDRLDAKLRLIELQLIVAYDSKVNFQDVFSQVRTWDTAIYNFLRKRNIVMPQKTTEGKTGSYSGAYVMEPLVGMFDWVVSFDVTSLYPTIMRLLNMGIETKVDKKDLTAEQRNYLARFMERNVDGGPKGPAMLLNGESDIEMLRKLDCALSANGILYTRDKPSFYSDMIDHLFKRRVEFKNKAQKGKKVLEAIRNELKTRGEAAAADYIPPRLKDSTNEWDKLDLRKPEDNAELVRIIAKLSTLDLKTEEKILVNEVAKFDLFQKATKISLNSLYGVIGNGYFRFFDLENAEAVTLTGQFIIQYIARALDEFLNKMCKTQGVRYVLYCDTDSVYLSMDKVVGMLKSRKADITHSEIIDNLDKTCSGLIEPFITQTFRDMVTNSLNGVGDFLFMKRESIADKAMWTAKKRYILNVYDDEGVRHKEADLKYIGVEIAKASAPKFCRDAMLKAVKLMMKGEREALWKLVEETRATFDTLQPEDIGFPRSVNGLEKYKDPSGRSPFVAGQGTPFHTKGALTYNFLLKTHQLGGKYQEIKEGEKIKYLYLKEPNKTKDRVIAFLNVLPKELGLNDFVDYNMQFEKSFIEPLGLILNPIGWSAEKRATLDSFFED